MRTAFALCLRQQIRRTVPVSHYQKCFSNIPRSSLLCNPRRSFPRPRHTLWALLTPAAFVRLSEEDNGDGKTPEEHMLEASRAEIQKHVPDNVHGLSRVWRYFYLFVGRCIYEPIATGFRFLHLVVIFVPVIAAAPALWFGRRRKDRGNERTGTLWWYGFLVHSMERAGPAFIKVPGLKGAKIIINADSWISSWGNGPLQDQTSFLPKCVVSCPLSTRTRRPTLWKTRRRQ